MSEFPIADFEAQADGDRLLANALRTRKILEEYGLSGGRVAVYGKAELSLMFGILTKLAQQMPEVEFIGEGQNDSTILRAMETKDDVEVARIRQMGAVTTTVVQMVWDYLAGCDVREDEVLLKENGTPLTIGDVKGKIALWLAEREAVDVEGLIFAIGRDAGVPHSSGDPNDLMTLGKTIVFDIFPAEKGGGYFYDFTRTWSLGYATPEAQALYDQVHEIYDRAVENLDLNASFIDYQRMTCEYFEFEGAQDPAQYKIAAGGLRPLPGSWRWLEHPRAPGFQPDHGPCRQYPQARCCHYHRARPVLS